MDNNSADIIYSCTLTEATALTSLPLTDRYQFSCLYVHIILKESPKASFVFLKNLPATSKSRSWSLADAILLVINQYSTFLLSHQTCGWTWKITFSICLCLLSSSCCFSLAFSCSFFFSTAFRSYTHTHTHSKPPLSSQCKGGTDVPFRSGRLSAWPDQCCHRSETKEQVRDTLTHTWVSGPLY